MTIFNQREREYLQMLFILQKLYNSHFFAVRMLVCELTYKQSIYVVFS